VGGTERTMCSFVLFTDAAVMLRSYQHRENAERVADSSELGRRARGAGFFVFALSLEIRSVAPTKARWQQTTRMSRSYEQR
jgi:hypothetical protein